MRQRAPFYAFAAVMLVLGAVGAALAGGVSVAADAPSAIATITTLLGIDKAAEDAEIERLGSPPKPLSLPPKPQALAPPVPSLRGGELEDDIPF